MSSRLPPQGQVQEKKGSQIFNPVLSLFSVSLFSFLFCALLLGTLSGCGKKPEAAAPSAAEMNLPSATEPTADSQPPEIQPPPADPLPKPADSPDTPPEPSNLRDPQRLQELGIEIFEDAHIQLLVDQVTPDQREELTRLPTLMAQLKDQLEHDIPELQASLRVAQQQSWQESRNQGDQPLLLQAHLMRERALFLQAGLFPEEFADLTHGIEQGYQFWLMEQPTPYYRRHLLFHETVHALLNRMPHQWPVWFEEGIAEWYAVHTQEAAGLVQFAQFPGIHQIQGGFGRLELVRQEVKAGRFRTLSEVASLADHEFYPHKTSYAWSWAACSFLAQQEQTRELFLQLCQTRTRLQFFTQWNTLLDMSGPPLQADWAVFVSSLTPDYDFARSTIRFTPPAQLSNTTAASTNTAEATIQSDRHWQGSGIQVEQGKTYQIAARGRYTLAQNPEPWECEPQGVSIDYREGQPLGQVQLVLYTPAHPGLNHDHGFLTVVPMGRDITWTAELPGELFFRINDSPADWKNNRGEFQVRVSPAD